MTRLPDFLVIGAMKSGTTTLYRDLESHPDVVLAEKELSALNSRDGSVDEVRSRFARQLAGAPPGARLGDVSTTYAMHPHLPSPARLAARVLGPDLKVLYLVRRPIDRIVSHHHHDLSRGRLHADVDTAVRTDPRLLDYTRYATQLRPWLDELGEAAVRVVSFEDYVRDRAGTMREVFAFLDLPSVGWTSSRGVHNVSAGRPVAAGGWRRVVGSRAYRQVLRPLVPEGARRWAARALLPAAPARPEPPSDATVRLVDEELRGEVEALTELTGRRWWDLDERAGDPPTRRPD